MPQTVTPVLYSICIPLKSLFVTALQFSKRVVTALAVYAPVQLLEWWADHLKLWKT